jgi:hypothetical protein
LAVHHDRCPHKTQTALSGDCRVKYLLLPGTRGILIAGTESSLSAAIAAEAAKRVESFAAAFIPNRLSPPGGGGINDAGARALIPLIWNSGSPISAECTTPRLRRSMRPLTGGLEAPDPARESVFSGSGNRAWPRHGLYSGSGRRGLHRPSGGGCGLTPFL